MKLGEECGVFGGIAFEDNIAPIIRKGLFMLQHRGQESAGLCCGDQTLSLHKDKGMVMEVLKNKVVKNISGKSGIGHVRYSTQGGSDSAHAQPYMVKYLDENVAIAHNGNVKAAIDMRKKLEQEGEVFLTSSDTEMILKKVISALRKAPSQWTYEEVGKVLSDYFTGGAWSILFGFPGRVIGLRDPLGFRPLFFCEAEGGYFLSSEDSAFQLLEPKNIIEIQPGEGVEITPNGYRIQRFAEEMPSKKCVFEHIYFARPDSNVFGRNVYQTRVEFGKRCAIENNVEADMVIPVMDSGFAAAIGYSLESGIPLHMGLVRNHWVGRTFIQPQQKERRKGVQRKLMPIASVVSGKRLILIDDSIVRGTTSKEIVRMLKKAGAKEVHFRIASPMIINTCFWGVDIPTKEELIANSYESVEEIRNYLEADSLAYLSFDGLKQIFGIDGWCYHCFENSDKIRCDENVKLQTIGS
ncbi:MAG: amidophosphoribosyltransferase [Candidatus Melainabacteria bacterium RIFOXYA2_FULL_32_9]|nr:MAG: amidophosphoribosyltransferase [Candidatus Melainabacteria bacterium RIFOXYA2_FULL_32_9]